MESARAGQEVRRARPASPRRISRSSPLRRRAASHAASRESARPASRALAASRRTSTGSACGCAAARLLCPPATPPLACSCAAARLLCPRATPPLAWGPPARSRPRSTTMVGRMSPDQSSGRRIALGSFETSMRFSNENLRYRKHRNGTSGAGFVDFPILPPGHAEVGRVGRAAEEGRWVGRTRPKKPGARITPGARRGWRSLHCNPGAAEVRASRSAGCGVRQWLRCASLREPGLPNGFGGHAVSPVTAPAGSGVGTAVAPHSPGLQWPFYRHGRGLSSRGRPSLSRPA
jgi:hypothetical protein